MNTPTAKDYKYMQQALELAQLAGSLGEVPVGCVVVCDDKVIATGYNRREIDEDPSAHAEFIALKQASQILRRWRLSGCSVYVTLEPCIMCAGMMINARVDRCVFGAYDSKSGALESLYKLNNDNRLNHSFEVMGGVLEEDCGQVLKDFFKERRAQNKLRKQLQKLENKSPDSLDLSCGQDLIQHYEGSDKLALARKNIDQIDEVLLRMFHKRMQQVEQVGLYKKEHGLGVADALREEEKKKQLEKIIPRELQAYGLKYLEALMGIAKEYQSDNMSSNSKKIT